VAFSASKQQPEGKSSIRKKPTFTQTRLSRVIHENSSRSWTAVAPGQTQQREIPAVEAPEYC